jgi:hypothetical protein
METRTIDILDYGFLIAGIVESVVLFPYKLDNLLHCPELQCSAQSVCWLCLSSSVKKSNTDGGVLDRA